MNDQDKIAEQAAEIARLTKTIAWYQGQAAQRIGEAARAGIAGAPAGVPQTETPALSAVQHAIHNLKEHRAGRSLYFPGYAIGILERFVAASVPQLAVPQGYKLVPIKITPEMIERGIEAHYGKRRIAQVGGAQGVSMTVNNTDWSGVEAMRNFWRGALSAAPAAPLPEQTGPIAILAKTASMDDFNQSSVPSYAQFLAWAIWRDNYKEISPDFEIMADTWGALSQIDNMVCGMALKPAASPSPAPAPTDTSTMEDPILVPRGLIGAACYVLRKDAKNDKLLKQLRAFTFDRHPAGAAPAQQQEPSNWRRIAKESAHHLEVWLAQDDCECEGGHTCGKPLVQATLHDLKEVLSAAESSESVETAAPGASTEDKQ